MEADIYVNMDTDNRNPSSPPPVITALRPSAYCYDHSLQFLLVRNPKMSGNVPSSVTGMVVLPK